MAKALIKIAQDPLTDQQRIYRNHLIRVNKQSQALIFFAQSSTLSSEAVSHIKALNSLAVKLTDIVINKRNTTNKVEPLFNQILGTFEMIRINYAPSYMSNTNFATPIKQIRDSLAWMHDYHRKAKLKAVTNIDIVI